MTRSLTVTVSFLVLLSLALVLPMPGPRGGREYQCVGDMLHAPLFAILAIFVFALARARVRSGFSIILNIRSSVFSDLSKNELRICAGFISVSKIQSLINHLPREMMVVKPLIYLSFNHFNHFNQ